MVEETSIGSQPQIIYTGNYKRYYHQVLETDGQEFLLKVAVQSQNASAFMYLCLDAKGIFKYLKINKITFISNCKYCFP